MPVKPLPPKPIVSPLFRKVFGDGFADFIEDVAQKRTKSKIDSVGRERGTGVTQRQPVNPEDEQHWLDKLDK